MVLALGKSVFGEMFFVEKSAAQTIAVEFTGELQRENSIIVGIASFSGEITADSIFLKLL